MCIFFLFYTLPVVLHSRNGRNLELDMNTYPKYIGVLLP